MINCVEYKDVKTDILKMMKRRSLIPVIGSGFTKDCMARVGKVPSGEDYYCYMIEQIVEATSGNLKIEELNNESFSSISSIYHATVDEDKQRSYLNNAFTKVKLENNKMEFLKIDWPYIYTLNMDDGIENNSEYKRLFRGNGGLKTAITPVFI